MKSILAPCLAVLLSAPFAMAEQEHIFPDKDPVIELKLPDDWDAQVKNGRFYANPKDDKAFFVEIEEMQSKPDDGEAVMIFSGGMVSPIQGMIPTGCGTPLRPSG
jgi:hypothetical protein